jgi:hypothetical protein
VAAILAAAILAAQPAPGGSADDLAGADERIGAFVRYLAGRGITLRRDRDGWWRVERPHTDGYDVIVSLRTFPPTAGEDEMRKLLTQVSLAFVLNPRARLAMSYPSARGKLPDGTSLGDLRVRRELLRLFSEYGGP